MTHSPTAAHPSPSSSCEWDAPQTGSDGLVTQTFRLAVNGRRVPGVLWTPPAQAGGAPRPLVLMGHGGSQHKLAPDMVSRAARWVLDQGFAAAAIDGPVHGERREVIETGLQRQAEFLAMWERDHHIDPMVEDWRATLDALLALDAVDAARVVWYGVSMGTAYGLPLIAAEPRIRAAVLGMWGASYPNSERLMEDAPRVQCPVLFQQKWDDAIFTRDSQIALFERLGCEQKWLKVYPGPHAVTPELLDDAIAFIERALEAGSGAAP